MNLLKSDTVLSNHKLICCGHLLQMRSAHRQSKYLSSNQIQTEPTPRSVSLLWLSAQTVAILPLKMVRQLLSFTFIGNPRDLYYVKITVSTYITLTVVLVVFFLL